MLVRVSNTDRAHLASYLTQSLIFCSPIVTYQGKGVKKDAAKDEHAIVYTTKAAPQPSAEERPKRGEKPMRTPIRVQPDERGDKLLDMCRIDYGRVYTVEHNIKAMAFGWIHDASRKDFHFDFLNVFMGSGGYDAWVAKPGQANEGDERDDLGDSDRADGDTSGEDTTVGRKESHGKGKIPAREEQDDDDDDDDDEEDDDDDDDDDEDDDDSESDEEDAGITTRRQPVSASSRPPPTTARIKSTQKGPAEATLLSKSTKQPD